MVLKLCPDSTSLKLSSTKPRDRVVLSLVGLIANTLLVVDGAHAGPQLNGLAKAIQPCLAVGKPQACPQGVAALERVRRSSAYASADRFCKEQVTQMGRVLALLPVQDVTDQTVQGSLDGLVQACAPFGL